MVNEREAIRRQVAQLAGGRPVRWTDARTSMGDFSGRDWTIEVFDVPAVEHQELREQLRELKREVRTRLGHAMTVILHTPENTQKYYAWVRTELQPVNSSS
jgi:hypothetical protein